MKDYYQTPSSLLNISSNLVASYADIIEDLRSYKFEMIITDDSLEGILIANILEIPIVIKIIREAPNSISILSNGQYSFHVSDLAAYRAYLFKVHPVDSIS